MFTFKQFTIDDSACAMKVGTDGVLLGAWASMVSAPSASPKGLDMGTGSGVIALMMAQRFPDMTVDAVDIDESAVNQARENAKNSPFGNRVNVWQADIHNMDSDVRYDLIVSNPPFYQEQTSCPDNKRDTARHTSSLSFDILISKARELLNEGGTFCVIIPTSSTSDFIGTAAIHGFYMCGRTDIHTTPRKVAKRTMLAFTDKIAEETDFRKLYMRNADNEFSAEYKKLTGEFYL